MLAFRERCLVDFVGDFVAYVARQGAAADRLPAAAHRRRPRDRATGRGWPSLPGLHTFGTDPYWQAFGEHAEAMVGEYARRVVAPRARARRRARSCGSRASALEPQDADDIRAAVRVAREAGIDDLWTWGFEACGHMSALGGSDPAAGLGRAVRRLAHGGARVITEGHDADLADLDLRATADVVRALNDANAVVLDALRDAEDRAASRLVDAAAARAGRVVYVGRRLGRADGRRRRG